MRSQHDITLDSIAYCDPLLQTFCGERWVIERGERSNEASGASLWGPTWGCRGGQENL